MGAWNLVWNCREPASWPAPPKEMTYSSLVAIEICPRRWALHSANYSELWAEHGYPPRIVIKGLTGTIVHSIAETVSRELVRAGCASISDANAVQVMRALGGYSKLISLGIDGAIERCRDNPRATRLIEQLAIVLRGKAAEIRTQVQGLLANFGLTVGASGGNAAPAVGRSGPLQHGLYAELTLRARGIGWKGKPDLLGLDSRGCQIVEFKTGERRDDHVFQVLVYGALWSMDDELNPKAQRPFKLTVAYPDGNIDIPVPTSEQLSALIAELRSRTTNAVHCVSQRPPSARPSIENCRFCGVKQLCSEYWIPDIQRRVQPDSGVGGYADLQVRIAARHGPTSWDATIESSGTVPAGSLVLVRSTSSDLEMRTGDRLRLIDVWFGADTNESKMKVATAGMQSEVYLVD